MEGFDAAMAADISAGNIQIQPGTPAPTPAAPQPEPQPASTPPAEPSPKTEPTGTALDALPDMNEPDAAAEE
ncbi:MAG: hypothetical protein E6Q97_22985, partial [Desulfurellales bacterium]